MNDFVAREAVADSSVVRSEGAESRPYSWLDDYFVPLEGEAASRENLDAREYYVLVASLLA